MVLVAGNPSRNKASGLCGVLLTSKLASCLVLSAQLNENLNISRVTL